MDSNEIIDAAGRFITAVGFGKAIAAYLIWQGCRAIGRLYIDHTKEKETNAALDEKERTIQRLAQDNRELRIVNLKVQGWSVDEIDRFVIRNEFKNPAEARGQLESTKAANTSKE